MLLGAARVLADHDLPRRGRIRLSFQPGEEGHAGAGVMIEEGLLDGVDAAFALHVSPNIPAGYLASRPGPLLASADEFHISVVGQGGHASTPHFGNDPIPVACEMVGAFQTAITRRINAFDPAVLTVARISAGTTSNVIPERAEVVGTIRAVSEPTRAAVHAEVQRIAEHVAAAHGCRAEVEVRPGYPVTVNDATFTPWVADVVEAQLGPGRFFELPTPVMGAEDFSYVLRQVPGAMAFLGVCPTDIPNSLEAPGCHSNRMRIDEDAMAVGVAMHVAVATAYLDQHA
jgi:hippurate hydrolase